MGNDANRDAIDATLNYTSIRHHHTALFAYSAAPYSAALQLSTTR